MNTRTGKGHLPAIIRYGRFHGPDGKLGQPVRMYWIIGNPESWISEQAYKVADLRWQVEQKHNKEDSNG